MSRITILGAGAMGSAFATPSRKAGFETHLWGTHLDTEIIVALRQGQPHPRTGERLADGVVLFEYTELAAAIEGADLVACAIASDGVRDVMRATAAAMAAPRPILLMSKGFDLDGAGRVELLTDTVSRELAARGLAAPVVAVGGPCKANEVAAGRATAAVFAADPDLAVRLATQLAGDDYAIEASDDPVGVEVSAALKNVFAIALGFCDGLAERTGKPWHDLKAATFAESVTEIALVVELMGGQLRTAFGLAGVGDLEVTGLSGRNRAYGERIGRGLTPQVAFDEMRDRGLTVEGHVAVAFARQLVDERGGDVAWERLPLLRLLATGLEAGTFGEELERALAGAVLPRRDGRRTRG